MRIEPSMVTSPSSAIFGFCGAGGVVSSIFKSSRLTPTLSPSSTLATMRGTWGRSGSGLRPPRWKEARPTVAAAPTTAGVGSAMLSRFPVRCGGSSRRKVGALRFTRSWPSATRPSAITSPHTVP